MAQNAHSKSFWTTLVRKSWKNCKTVQIGHSKSFWWGNLKNGPNWLFQTISDHFGRKIWEKLENGPNLPFQTISDPFSGKIFEKFKWAVRNLRYISHNMNATKHILVKLLCDPIGIVAITNDLHCLEVKITMQVLNLVQHFLI